MGVFATYSNLMTYILPIICSAICSVFTFFLIWNYRNLAERKLRRVVSIYCILIAVWWSSFLWHARSDDPVFLPVDIPLQHRLLPDLFRGPKKLSRTELPLAGTHVGDHPDSDNLDIASQGRNFYRVVAVRAIYGAFHIRPFTAVYHSGSLYRSDRPIVVAVL